MKDEDRAKEQLADELVAMRQRITELERILEISRELTSALTLEPLLKKILAMAAELTDSEAASILLLDTRAGELRFCAATGGWSDQLADITVPIEGSIAGTILTSRKPLIVRDVRADPRYYREVDRQIGFETHSLLGMPLQIGNRCIGALEALNKRGDREFSQEDVETLTALVAQAAIAIENAQLFGEAQQRVAELEALQRTSLQLTSSLDLSAVLDSIAESALTLVEATDCHIYLYDETSDTFTFDTALWDDGRREPVLQPRPDGLMATVVREGHPIVINDAPRHPFYSTPKAQKWGLQAIAGFPLKRAGHVLGAFSIAFLEPHTFSQEELRVLGLLADQATIAIENARLYEEVLDHAERLEERVRERTAELEARNEELDAFSHTVAHDLKAPLTNIIGFAEVLKDDYATMPDEELPEHLHTIAQIGRKMSNIVDELLLFAGLRKTEVEMRPLDMASIVCEALQRLAYMVEEHQAEVILPDTWPVALGYSPWVEEVWVNYLSNALKYGGQPPRLELGATARADGRVHFWVRDNGPGLTAEEQARLFSPFTRLDQVRATGHGLGLSIVRRIVEKLGGQVGIESEVGRGSMFTFSLLGISHLDQV